MLLKWMVLLIFILSLIYCEFLNYYFVISQCTWPKFKNEEDEKSKYLLKTLFLADTHLLGPFRGHWIDKLRREWQMHRAFQTAMLLHRPEIVFVLGDLFDEGQWCNEAQFQEYVARFFSLFEVPHGTKIFVVPGNHDIGFHHALYQRSILSMAMEGDGCYFCWKAEKKLMELAEELNCIKHNKTCKLKKNLKKYSRPIIIQHFPMYRKSDSECNERDEAPPEIKNKLFREKWDCLSEEASQMIYDKLHPRLIVAGHVHHGCHIIHKNDIHEYTLSSFSWRNKNNPTYMLAKFTPNNFVIEKCDMPKESTVIIIYSCIILLGTVLIVCFRKSQKTPEQIPYEDHKIK